MFSAQAIDSWIFLSGSALVAYVGWRAPAFAACDISWKDWDQRWGRYCRIGAPFLAAISLIEILMRSH
jgi:hypothetical protein